MPKKNENVKLPKDTKDLLKNVFRTRKDTFDARFRAFIKYMKRHNFVFVDTGWVYTFNGEESCFTVITNGTQGGVDLLVTLTQIDGPTKVLHHAFMPHRVSNTLRDVENIIRVSTSQWHTFRGDPFLFDEELNWLKRKASDGPSSFVALVSHGQYEYVKASRKAPRSLLYRRLVRTDSETAGRLADEPIELTVGSEAEVRKFAKKHAHGEAKVETHY